MKEKTKDLEKVSFGIAIMFLLYWIYEFFISYNLDINPYINALIGLVCLYGIGLAIFLFVTKGIKKTEIEKKEIDFKTIAISFMLQFTAIIIVSIVTIVFTSIVGEQMASETDSDTLNLFNLFILLIFNPIFEELVFRKLFADKLLKHGELFYITSSAFCFALVHPVMAGLPVFIYTFILGFIWAYLYVKTGNILVPIILHSLSNFFNGGIFMAIIEGFSDSIVNAYSMLMMVLAVGGLVAFCMNKKRINIDRDNKLISKSVLKDLFVNKGIIFFISISIIMYIITGLVWQVQ